MNYLIKSTKNQQKTSSDVVSKSKKKQISSSRMIIKHGNIISTSIKKNYFVKNKKILGIKKYIKTNNKSESNNNTRDSNKKIILNDQYKKEESKGDFDIFDDNSANILKTAGLNNESFSNNNNNSCLKRTLVSSSKNIINNEISTDNLIISNYNTNTNDLRKRKMYSEENSLKYLSVCKSKSNKEIKNNNNDNFNNDTNKKTDITQRCRHKQVKREIYINNINKKNNKIEIKNKDINNCLNSNKKVKKDENSNIEDLSSIYGKLENELLIDYKERDKNYSIPKLKKNNNIIKKHRNLLDLYNDNNQLNRKTNTNNYIIEDKDLQDNYKNNRGYNNNGCYKNNNIEYFKNLIINNYIKNIKSTHLNNSENTINNNNNNNSVSNKYNQMKSNEDLNEFRKINNYNVEQNKHKNKSKNDSLYSNINNNILDNKNKKLYRKIKNQNIIRNYDFINSNNTEKKHKDNDICFDENELDENTLSISNGKYVENKKCQTMINKVLHFETSSNELFNHFRVNTNNNISTSINNMSFLNKNQSTKRMNDKKNSCNTIIDSNYNNINYKINNNNNNNINGKIKNINIIKKNNIEYNMSKKEIKLKDENLLKKCYTDVLIDNNRGGKNIFKEFNNNNEDNKSSEESSTTSFKMDKNIINESKNLMMIKKIRNLNNQNNNKKNFFHKIFQCKEFKKLLLSFCDLNLLNKICLLSKQIYKYMKPLIYNKINSMIYNPNKMNRNLKIKKYLMEQFSPLSKFSPAIIRKKYTDLIFENNHKYDTEIKKDLTRTFPDNILFKYGNSYYNKLYHILTAFSNYNKNIGYAQGINFLAANIIYFFDEEIEEFIFLDALIHKFDLDKILCTTNSNFFIKKLKDINNFIIQRLPKLNEYLENMALNCEFFTTNWILTLFSNSMETQFLFYIWDYMIIFGWKFFKCFSVAVLMNFENDILNSTENNINFIKKSIRKSNKFNIDFKNIIFKTLQMIIKEE